jgi:hypothetical protein
LLVGKIDCLENIALGRGFQNSPSQPLSHRGERLGKVVLFVREIINTDLGVLDHPESSNAAGKRPQRQIKSLARLSDKIPDGWELYIHPHGSPYFVNRSWNVVTMSNVTNKPILDSLTRWYEDIVTDYGCYMAIFDDYDLVIEVDEDDEATCRVVDHKHRKITLGFPVDDDGEVACFSISVNLN